MNLDLNNSEGTQEFENLTPCSNTDEDNSNDCHSIQNNEKTYSISPQASNSIFGYTRVDGTLTPVTKTISATEQVYDLVIFINETNQNQEEIKKATKPKKTT